MVSVKVLRNDKDCLDAGLGEVRVLALVGRRDPRGEQQLLRLLDYFYFKVRALPRTQAAFARRKPPARGARTRPPRVTCTAPSTARPTVRPTVRRPTDRST